MEARFTEHGCEFRLLLSYFSVHIRPILRGAQTRVVKQSICGSKRGSKRVLVKSWHSLLHDQALPQGKCPSLVYRGDWDEGTWSSNRRLSTIPALLVQQKIRNLNILWYKPTRGACLSRTSTQKISDSGNIGNFWRWNGFACGLAGLICRQTTSCRPELS